MFKNKSKLKKLSQEDLILIEKQLLTFREKELKAYQHYSKTKYKLYLIYFSEGVFKGLGFFIGGTVTIALLTLLISKFLIPLPIIGDYFQEIQTVLEEGRKRSFDLD